MTEYLCEKPADLRGALSDDQRRVHTEIWRHYQHTKQWLTSRMLYTEDQP